MTKLKELQKELTRAAQTEGFNESLGIVSDVALQLIWYIEELEKRIDDKQDKERIYGRGRGPFPL